MQNINLLISKMILIVHFVKESLTAGIHNPEKENDPRCLILQDDFCGPGYAYISSANMCQAVPGASCTTAETLPFKTKKECESECLIDIPPHTTIPVIDISSKAKKGQPELGDDKMESQSELLENDQENLHMKNKEFLNKSGSDILKADDIETTTPTNVDISKKSSDLEQNDYDWYDYKDYMVNNAVVCQGGCGNGVCTRPEQCSCHTGYAGTRCQTAVCSGGCGNGVCTRPEQCSCKTGYAGTMCQTAVCSGGCGNGVCARPEQCSCNTGYAGTMCQTAVCSGGCGNGVCTRPEQCSCHTGYEGTKCQTAVCSGGCGNGVCTRPEQCSCHTGYAGTKCQTAVCRGGCGNGVCTRPEQCSCHTGYQGNKCQMAVCRGGCGNGVCTRPEQCSCHTGYQGNKCQMAEEPFWCSLISPKKCKAVVINCPKTCAQNAVSTTPIANSGFPNFGPSPSQSPSNSQIPSMNTAADTELCGISREIDEKFTTTRIANGRPAIAGMYPWMVNIRYPSDFYIDFVSCGGTLISPKWVLSAAHCFRLLKPYIEVTLKIGWVDLTIFEPGTEFLPITDKNIIIHEHFGNSGLDNDIALIRLSKDLKLSNHIKIICLGTNADIPFGGSAITAGWGLHNAGDSEIPNLLHEVELDMVNDTTCGNNSNKPDLFICTYTPGKDTCLGDSGGPLMVMKGKQWFQIGITSSGPINCGESTIPSSYTRLPNYEGWISSIINLFRS